MAKVLLFRVLEASNPQFLQSMLALLFYLKDGSVYFRILVFFRKKTKNSGTSKASNFASNYFRNMIPQHKIISVIQKIHWRAFHGRVRGCARGNRAPAHSTWSEFGKLSKNEV